MLKRTTPGGVRVFLVDDVSPEEVNMLMALYARSGASVEAHYAKVMAERRLALSRALSASTDPTIDVDEDEGLVDAAMALWSDNHPTVRAEKLNQRYVVGYGHKSIADIGSTALFVEGASMIVAKALQDTPLYCGQEMSTRAVDCGAQPYVDPIGTDESAAHLERSRAFYKRALAAAVEETRLRHPVRSDDDPVQYERAVGMRAFDAARGFLPFGCSTQVGWSGTLRHVGDRLGVLRYHPSAEVRDVVGPEGLLGLCRDRYPSSHFGEAVATGVGLLNEREQAAEDRRAWTERATAVFTYMPESPMRVDGHRKLFGFRSDIRKRPDASVIELVASRPRGALLPPTLNGLGQVHYDFLLDMGSKRDLDRHRAVTVEPALLTANYGFERWYDDQLPEALRGEALAFRQAQLEALNEISSDPVARQYYLPMGYLARTRVTAGLPGLVYLLEIRSGKTTHPTLRERVLEMWELFHDQHPEVAVHVDSSQDDWTLRRGAQVILAKCARCRVAPVAYEGAIYCGAGCSARAEAGL